MGHMISSMTGFGRGTANKNGTTVLVELRTVNSRFLEMSARLPRSLSLRENDIKELIRRRFTRGKVNLLVTVERGDNGSIPLVINASAARSYFKLLTQLRKSFKIRESIKLDHLLQFTEIFEQDANGNSGDQEWDTLQVALNGAMDALETMRRNEGRELERDFRSRIQFLDESLAQVERIAEQQIPAEHAKMRDRISQLLQTTPVDEGRLEMELALLADRLDVTEECVRFRSHNKFFLEAFASAEPPGRKLNFLIQEMNREANTIGSKSSSTEISHIVVKMKEELEKIREQLQNIE